MDDTNHKPALYPHPRCVLCAEPWDQGPAGSNYSWNLYTSLCLHVQVTAFHLAWSDHFYIIITSHNVYD